MNVRTLFLFGILYLGVVSIAIAEEIVFEGIPVVKGVSTLEESYNTKLQGEDNNRYKLVITRTENSYIWFSREKKELDFVDTNSVFYLFISKNGDYIKISREKTDFGYLYIEHLSDGFKEITYWGQGEKINTIK